MNLTSDRVRSIGWVSVLVACGLLTLGFTLRVNAVKSQVHDTEKSIVYAQQQIDFLQTEFATRSNQQALRELNDLEFGYKAPLAAQYIEGERQLASLGVGPGPGAPAPIRYANADTKAGEGSEKSAIMAMVSPVTGAVTEVATGSGKAAAVARGDGGRDPERDQFTRDAAALGKRLAHIEVAEVAQQ